MKTRSTFLLVYSFFTVLLGLDLVHAVTNSETVKTNSKLGSNRGGIYVEALYSMLKTEGAKNQNYVINPTVILNQPIYTVGFGLGYRLLRSSNVGFEAGGQVIQESGQLGTSHSAFYQLNGNLTYSVNSNFYGFAGPSLNYLSFNSNTDYKSVQSSPALGGQLGLGYLYKGFYGKLSYQYMPFVSQFDYVRSTGGTVSINNDFKMSGLVTQIGYNF